MTTLVGKPKSDWRFWISPIFVTVSDDSPPLFGASGRIVLALSRYLPYKSCMETLKGMIDSHFHGIPSREKGIEIISVIREAVGRGMTGFLDVGTHETDIAERSSFYREIPEVFLTAGMDPHASLGNWESGLSLIEQALNHPKIRAVGEIGLDYHWNYATPETQRALFEAQLVLASRYGLPVVVHSRDADKDTYEILKTSGPREGGIIHCFSYDYSAAKRYADLGFFISFAGNITYKRSEDIQDAARRLPAELILMETDSPYLAPLPLRGRVNDPRNIGCTYARTAELRGMGIDELIAAVGDNFTKFLKRCGRE